jgi:hypothetical protein
MEETVSNLVNLTGLFEENVNEQGSVSKSLLGVD